VHAQTKFFKKMPNRRMDSLVATLQRCEQVLVDVCCVCAYTSH
jgi:hypothetical protein